MKNFDGTIDVKNAGLVIINPFFPMLFYRLGYMNDDHRNFKDEDSKIRAIFILQYLVYGEENEWSESELFINKLLLGVPDTQGLPRSLKLTENEIKTADSLLESVRHSWDKMAHTSMLALRQVFFQRKGSYTYDERIKHGVLKVETKPYDRLMDSMPWKLRLIRYPWMEMGYILEIDWKLR